MSLETEERVLGSQTMISTKYVGMDVPRKRSQLFGHEVCNSGTAKPVPSAHHAFYRLRSQCAMGRDSKVEGNSGELLWMVEDPLHG